VEAGGGASLPVLNREEARKGGIRDARPIVGILPTVTNTHKDL